MVYTNNKSSNRRGESTWEARRQKATERFISLFDDRGTDHTEEIIKALDALTLAHMALALDDGLTGGLTDRWKHEARAMGRFVAAWKASGLTEEHPDAEEAINFALDELAVAHAARTFEELNGPLKW